MIYFDSAATSLQKPPEVWQAMQNAMDCCASVGRGGHAAAMAAAQTVFDCRTLAAQLFSCREEQVVFTMNATHGLNLAIHSLLAPGDRVLLTGFEHNAVTRPLHALRARAILAGSRLFDDARLLEEFEAGLRKGPAAAVCTQVSNVFGYVLPMEQMAALCRRYGVRLIIDASQAAGCLPVSLHQTGAAFIAMPGHKGLCGPQGTGILLCGAEAKPLLYGGTGSESVKQTMPEELPERLEAGTHNVCGIAGLAAGLRYVLRRTPEKILAHERTLLAHLLRQMQELPGVRLFRGGAQSGVLSFQVQGEDCETAASRLGEAGVAVRAGLHCAPLAHETAGTLEEGTIRVSFSDFNTEQELAEFVQVCKKLFLH